MRWLFRLLSLPMALAINGLLFAVIGAFALYAWVAPGLPSQEELASVQLQQPLRVYTSDGLLIGEFGAERREPIKFEETPPLLIKAFLAAEDSRFFEHPGIDVQGLARAALSLLQTGEPRQGGSTITMQVARNFFLSPEKTFRRKLTELLLAMRIETELTKEQIFELYENKIFFGHRAYGISAAARVYYDKGVHDLTLAQMAMLAGVPQAPSVNNPVSRPKRALARRDYVLGRMYALGYVSEAAYRQALESPDDARLTSPKVELDAPYVAELARRDLFERYGEAAYTSGYRVTTTVSTARQQMARQALRVALSEYDERHGYRGAETKIKGSGAMTAAELEDLLEDYPPVDDLLAGVVTAVKADKAIVHLADGSDAELTFAGAKWARPNLGAPNRLGKAPRKLADVVAVGDLVRLRRDPEVEGTSWRLAQLPAVEGALVALSPADGAVQALIGGFDYGRSQFNRAVDARRQPGSSFKPFVYAAALERGWTPASILQDSPVELRDGSGKLWRPKNFDGKYLGDFTLNFMTRFGLELDQLPHGLSLVLGSASASPLQMAAAYARFANGGYRIEPYVIERVQDAAGETLFEARPPVACVDCFTPVRQDGPTSATVSPLDRPAAERVLDPRLAFQMQSLLSDVIREGTGRRARSLERTDLAGKTGTTNDSRDSWFCGFQKNLVTVSWMGFDDNSPLGAKETGGSAALTMWMEFMKAALAEEPEALPKEPPGLVHVLVNKRTGHLTHADDPEAFMEIVREEYEIMLLGPEPLATPRSSDRDRPASDYEEPGSPDPGRTPSGYEAPLQGLF